MYMFNCVDHPLIQTYCLLPFVLESSILTSNSIEKGSKIFAMVISLYLHVFSHRQLYVAFSSRVKSGSDDQKIGSLFNGSSGSYPQTKMLWDSQ